MAFTLNLTIPQGLFVPNAYVRIRSFAGTKSQMTMIVDAFASAAVAVEEKPPLTSYTFTECDISNGATMSEMYTFIKGVPDFAGATDC